MLKVGLVGTGFIGAAHAEAYKNAQNVTLAAVADLNEESGKKISKEYGAKYYKDAEEMMQKEDIDIVDICLPTFLHETYVLMAAKYKKHILCEKPFTLTLKSAQRMIDAANEAGVKLMVAQVIRFWPEYVTIKDYFEKDKIGNLKMVYANRLAQQPNWTDWHKKPENSGGGLFDLHLHDIDYMCYLFGEVESVYAVGWQTPQSCWDHIMTNMKFKNGKFAVVEGAFGMTDNYPFTMSFRGVGAKGTIEYTLRAGLNLEDVGSAIRNTNYFETGKDPVEIPVEEYDAYQKEIEYFVDCLINDEENIIIPPDDSKYVLKVILAIKKSLETGEVVKL